MNQFSLDSIGLPQHLITTIGIAGIIIFVLWRLFLAYLIMNDADRLFKKNRLFLNSNAVWIIATLLMGVAAIITYWLLHYSILLARTEEKKN